MILKKVIEKKNEEIEESFDSNELDEDIEPPIHAPSDENKKYIKKIRELQKSKKRCAAESELLKTYQKLVNYIP